MSPSSSSSSSKRKEDEALCHLGASGIAACINFPLWRASAVAQSGFHIEGMTPVARWLNAVTKRPFKGTAATIVGMTWARAAIFFGSDVGKQRLLQWGAPESVALVVPPLCIATCVQIMNMPLVRATITIQNPASELGSVSAALVHICKTKGLAQLWHGASAGILKAVPKYITAVVVKDFMEKRLPPPADPHNKYQKMQRSAIKSVAAGLAGAILTNPLDVLRNEMFKTDHSLTQCFSSLRRAHGWGFVYRGVSSNMVAVTIPVATTIFFTDILVSLKDNTV
jgi:hypothetical protein